MKVKLTIILVVLGLIILTGCCFSSGSSKTESIVSQTKLNSMEQDILNRFDYISQIDMTYSSDDDTIYCEFKISSQPESTETILKAVYAQMPLDDHNLYLGILDATGNELGYLTCVDGSVSVKNFE